MALAEQLDQRAGVRVVLARREQAHIVLDADAAHVRDQRLVGGRVFHHAAEVLQHLRMQPLDVELREPLAPVVRDLLLRPQIGPGRPAVVAGCTMPVQHRLHLAGEVEAAGRAVPGLDLARIEPHRQRQLRRRHSAGVSWQPTQESVSPGMTVNQLRISCTALPSPSSACTASGRVGRHAEGRRAVRFERHGAEDPHDLPGPAVADLVRPRQAGIAEVIGDHAQALDRPARHAGQARAGVHVVQIDDAVLALEIDPVHGHGRLGPLHDRDRLQQRIARLLPDQHEIVERVGQIDAPVRLRRPAGRRRGSACRSAGYGCRNFGQSSSTRLSAIFGSIGSPRPEIRWTRPVASYQPRLVSTSTSWPILCTP